ncbi:MAG: hypothetical protein GKS05_10070 [Nitrospirales bacterium]|nr:hypothetical protein [Nitrospirales bacterium]
MSGTFPVSAHAVMSSSPIQTRAPALQVGAIMALLATFEEAGILPPEDSPEATQLIHGLIQLQSAFMRSSDVAVTQFFSNALASYFFGEAQEAENKFRAQGWTSQTLEAILLYEAYPKAWHSPKLDEGLRVFNVTRADLKEVQIVFDQARQAFLAQRRDIHDVYDQWRRTMPGAGR